MHFFSASRQILEQNPLIIGRIPFLVCAPFFHQTLDNTLYGPFQFIDGPPNTLNNYLSEKKCDLAPSSSFEYARNPKQYLLSSKYCTAGKSEVQSVLLVTDLEIQELNNKHIWMTPKSATSRALLQVLLQVRYNLNCNFTEDTKRADAHLFIGDEALEHKNKNHYDLAKLWFDWQGTPFVFGAWIINRSIVLAKAKLLEHWWSHVETSLHQFETNPEQSLQTWIKRYGPAWAQDSFLNKNNESTHPSINYYNQLNYRFQESHKDSLQEFFKLCQTIKLIEDSPLTIEFI